VYLVSKYHVRKDWPANEAKSALPCRAVLLQHFRTRDVRRHQIGRELDAAELEMHRLRQCRNQQRLGESRHADEKRMAVREQRDKQSFDNVLLSNDALANLRVELLPRTGKALQQLNIMLIGLGLPRHCRFHATPRLY